MQWSLAVAVVLGVTVSGMVNEADARASDEPAAIGPPAPAPRPPPALHWHDEWRRFTVLELLLSAAVTARNADLGDHLDGPRSTVVDFHVPVLDPGGRDLFRANSYGVRQGAKRLSDVGFRTLVFAPYVFDAGIGALAVHQNPDVALQLALIDFEAFTFAGMTQLILSRTIGRKRPWAETCRPGDCESGDPVRSFDSGHSMASFTAAGLMCLHHEKLPLFGGGAPDTWACVWAVSAATATSSLRLVADEHWTSDVLFGAGLGWIYGYFLPKLLHFTSTTPTPPSSSGARATAVTWRPMFTGTPEGGTVGALGTF